MLTITIAVALLYTLAALAGYGFDRRTLNLENVWLKPLKFGISTVLYLGTLNWAMASLSADWRQGRAAFLIAATASVCALFELIYIGIQAARAHASHFNLTTPFHATMYSLMALAAVALVLSGAALGIVVFVDKAAALSAPMRWAIGIAFPLSTVLTILTALTMGGRLTHHVGLEPATALRLPLVGWSLTVGDMRVPHFIAMHLMQSAPLFAWFASRVAGDKIATPAVAVFCLAWTVLVISIFRIVLAGRPFFTLFS